MLIWRKSREIPYVEKLIDIDIKDIPNNRPITAPKINPNFISAQYHSDYMDVMSAFNDITPNQRQIFNVNNIPCKVTKNVDISKVSEIVNDFIQELNEDISKNVSLIHTANSSWTEPLPEYNTESGWQKFQTSLGLPGSLYNKPKMRTKVRLVKFSDIVKYETENEIRYICHIVISKDKVKDNLVIKVSFVFPKKVIKKENFAIVLEDISVLGYLTTQGLGLDRAPLDDYYYFDSLEDDNMITGKTVVNEMKNKYNVRQAIMQERIDGMDSDVQDKYRGTPSPTEYDSYKMTQTIFDDMYDDMHGVSSLENGGNKYN